MRPGTINWLVLLAAIALSALVAIHWLNEASVPVTAERYAALCGGRPECDPQLGYIFGACIAGIVALGLAIGALWWWVVSKFTCLLLGPRASDMEKPEDA